MFVGDFFFPLMQLTPEEEQRRKLRRERNKVAASKCRMKRKEHVNTLRKVGARYIYSLERDCLVVRKYFSNIYLANKAKYGCWWFVACNESLGSRKQNCDSLTTIVQSTSKPERFLVLTSCDLVVLTVSAKGPCYQFKWPVNGRCADLVYCSSVYKPIFVLDCLTFVTVVVR